MVHVPPPPPAMKYATQALAPDAAEGEESVARVKPSGIGRVLNGGQPLACGHCKRESAGVDGELRNVDVSPQGVSTFKAVLPRNARRDINRFLGGLTVP